MANAQAEKPCYLLVRIRRLRGAYYLRQLRLCWACEGQVVPAQYLLYWWTPVSYLDIDSYH
jgi:hypothetical protein